MKTKAVTKNWNVGNMNYTTVIPAGLRVVPIKMGTPTRPLFYLDEFPVSLFPSGSCVRHDAVHYGIVLEQSEVDSEIDSKATMYETGQSVFCDRCGQNVPFQK